MSGLRARQKADRERRIIEAAAHYFRDIGFEDSHIEAIAERARVSVGTVYNYFESKGDMLVAVVSLEVNEILNAGEKLIANPPPDVEQAVNDLIAIYLDKDMWRNAMALTTRQPDTRFGRRYNHLDACLAAQVRDLIARLQKDGSVKPDVDTRAVGEMIFNNTNMMFTIFIKSDDMALDSLKSDIARQNKPLADAIRA
ncbi:MAG: TetR/AcrR family transcriptional regulator [Proteobacteria bacterium]|nr:TetR/AcrR family transcriptional regulator [Pseudomonadota bacterium]